MLHTKNLGKTVQTNNNNSNHVNNTDWQLSIFSKVLNIPLRKDGLKKQQIIHQSIEENRCCRNTVNKAEIQRNLKSKHDNSEIMKTQLLIIITQTRAAQKIGNSI